MKFTYAIKHKNKTKVTWISICTFSRLVILNFIHQNTFAFENLIRVSTPFCGNWLSSK